MLDEPSYRLDAVKYPRSHRALYLHGVIRSGPRSASNSFEQRAIDVDRRIFLMGDRDCSPEGRKYKLGKIFRAAALVWVGGYRAGHADRRGLFSPHGTIGSYTFLGEGIPPTGA